MIEEHRGDVPTATEEIETEEGTEDNRGMQTTHRRHFKRDQAQHELTLLLLMWIRR